MKNISIKSIFLSTLFSTYMIQPSNKNQQDHLQFSVHSLPSYKESQKLPGFHNPFDHQKLNQQNNHQQTAPKALLSTLNPTPNQPHRPIPPQPLLPNNSN